MSPDAHAELRVPRSRWTPLLLAALVLTGCTHSLSGDEPADQASGGPYVGTQIVWVDSYHAEYEWSAAIEQGLQSVLADSGAQITVFRMDTKNIEDSGERERIAADINEAIASLDPDVVIATDDNAQKFLVVPYLLETEVPVVFAGVNWDATGYGYPTPTVTGMVEVDLVERLMELLRPHAAGERVGYLSGDTSTDRKVVDTYNERFFEHEMPARFAQTFEEFKTAFLELQAQVDIMFIGNNAGIDGWDSVEAEVFLLENTVIPTGSRQTWMAPYVFVTLGRLGAEQGEWAANSALRIVDGTAPSDIPVTENQQGELFVNLSLAEAVGADVDPMVLRSAEIYFHDGR